MGVRPRSNCRLWILFCQHLPTRSTMNSRAQRWSNDEPRSATSWNLTCSILSHHLTSLLLLLDCDHISTLALQRTLARRGGELPSGPWIRSFYKLTGQKSTSRRTKEEISDVNFCRDIPLISQTASRGLYLLWWLITILFGNELWMPR